MKKENDVKKNVVKISCHPGSCRTGTCGVCRLYRCLLRKDNKQPINGRCRIAAFRHDRPLCNAGFTLIELLVVVLIIGILAAVALPQYETAVEKTRMTEAMVLLHAIAKANQVFFLENGRYAGPTELDSLDITIPGEIDTTWGQGRIRTKYFIYSPAGSSDGGDTLAMAQHVPQNGETSVYRLQITRSQPGRIRCYSDAGATSIQRKLCQKLRNTGSL